MIIGGAIVHFQLKATSQAGEHYSKPYSLAFAYATVPTGNIAISSSN